MTTPILQAAARILVSLLLLFSLFMLLRGHNAPGGGFIGGLIAAAAFALLSASHGVAEARRALRVDPSAVLAAGVATALLAGIAPMLAGEPPFAALWGYVGGDGGASAGGKPSGLALSTVLMFDLGVWLVVLGSILALVFALEDDDLDEGSGGGASGGEDG